MTKLQIFIDRLNAVDRVVVKQILGFLVSRKQLSSVVRGSKYSFEVASSNLILHFYEIPDGTSAGYEPFSGLEDMSLHLINIITRVWGG